MSIPLDLTYSIILRLAFCISLMLTYEEGKPFQVDGFDGVKICAGRLPTQDLTRHFEVFENCRLLKKAGCHDIIILKAHLR